MKHHKLPRMKTLAALNFILASVLATPALASEIGSEKTAEPKFRVGDCILNIEPKMSWYKKEAEVFDISQSSRYNAQVYVLYMRRPFHDEHTYGFYNIADVDETSMKVGEAPCSG